MSQAELDGLLTSVRSALAPLTVTERRMFGGVAFMLDGHMLCCASRRGLMVRVGRAAEADALQRPFAAPCLGTGRPMAGFITVAAEGLASERDLIGWLDLARTYVTTLPPKEVKSSRKVASTGRLRRSQ